MSEEIFNLLEHTEMAEPQIVGNIAMIGLLNERAPEESPVISLRDALRKKKIRVSEGPGGYTSLRAEADIPTLVRTSEAVSKAGKQDRVTKHSQIVRNPTTLDVYCIEHGRWGQGAKKEWEPVNLPVPIRRAVMEGQSQDSVWQIISSYLSQWKVQSRSQALAAIFDALGEQFEKFVSNFEWWANQVGMIVCINGVPSGLELFGSKNLFRDDGMHLLRESYVPEAMRGDKVPILPGDVQRLLSEFREEIVQNKRRYEIVHHNGGVAYATVI